MSNLKNYLAVFLILLYSNVSGQSDNGMEQSVKDYFSVKKIIGRFNFTGLLDGFDQNISIGVEYRFNTQWSTGSDAAYIFRSVYLSESKNVNGVILRPFIRYYLSKNGSGFVEAEIHYKYVTYQLTDWIGREVTNGVPAYEEYTTLIFHKRAFGLNIKVGDNVNLTRDKKFRLEPYIGLGIRFKKQGVDNGVYGRNRRSFGAIYDPEYSTIVLPLGMRLVYDIK